MASDGTGTVTPLRTSAAVQNAQQSKYFDGQKFKKQKTEDKSMAPPPLPPAKK